MHDFVWIFVFEFYFSVDKILMYLISLFCTIVRVLLQYFFVLPEHFLFVLLSQDFVNWYIKHFTFLNTIRSPVFV